MFYNDGFKVRIDIVREASEGREKTVSEVFLASDGMVIFLGLRKVEIDVLKLLDEGLRFLGCFEVKDVLQVGSREYRT